MAMFNSFLYVYQRVKSISKWSHFTVSSRLASPPRQGALDNYGRTDVGTDGRWDSTLGAATGVVQLSCLYNFI